MSQFPMLKESQLSLRVNHQTLEVDNKPALIVERSKKYLYYQIVTGEDWFYYDIKNQKIPLNIKIVLSTRGKEPIYIEGKGGFIPDDFIQAPGFTIGVIGTAPSDETLVNPTNKNKRISTNSIFIKVGRTLFSQEAIPVNELGL